MAVSGRKGEKANFMLAEEELPVVLYFSTLAAHATTTRTPAAVTLKQPFPMT